jgi:hypothetical protein
MSEGNQRYPPRASEATTGRKMKNSATPRNEPATAESPVSTAAITRVSAGVAPTNRIAASRRSRDAAESLVLVMTNTRVGTSRPITPSRMRIFASRGSG